MLDFMMWDIDTLLLQQQQGKLSSFDIVSKCLEQIALHNQDGAQIRAVIEVNPDALAIAQALDRDRERGVWRGPLHGIPILVKDNLDTADFMHTSAGSVAMATHRAAQDAPVVKRLREAGAVILGKANLTEWANFISDHMPNGYSSRGGQTLNPYGPGRFDVGGSSAGSGAAVAAGFAVAAIGTETSGSILSPASNNSLVGIKPTVGLVSRTGIIPISMGQDTAGPMTRTVSDAARILQVIAGEDKADAATASTAHLARDYMSQLRVGKLAGVRIGVPRGYYHKGLSDEEREVFDAAVNVLREKGATLVDPLELPTPELNENIDVMIHEFKVALNAYLAKTEATLPARTLAELIAYNDDHAEIALRYDQALFRLAEETSGSLTEAKYLQQRLRDLKWSREDGIDGALQEHGLAALVFPSYFGCSIAAKAGYPSITVPAGYTKAGQPVGLTFTGTAFSEAELIGLAYDFEQATKYRKAPQLD